MLNSSTSTLNSPPLVCQRPPPLPGYLQWTFLSSVGVTVTQTHSHVPVTVSVTLSTGLSVACLQSLSSHYGWISRLEPPKQTVHVTKVVNIPW